MALSAFAVMWIYFKPKYIANTYNNGINEEEIKVTIKSSRVVFVLEENDFILTTTIVRTRYKINIDAAMIDKAIAQSLIVFSQKI